MKSLLLEKKKHKRKKPSAQDQVHNKVNAGLMDVICMGGLEESKPDYSIGMENNSNLEYGHVTGGSAGAPINEESGFNADSYKDYFKSISKYMNTHGLTVKPYPSVQLNHTPQKGLFIYTGHYEPDNKKVVLFVNGRHPKDILRSFAHEMVHHAQNLRGDNLSFTDADNVKDNKRLEELESEAYLKGNIYFRKWTEYFKNGEQAEVLNESKKASKKKKKIYNDKGELVPDICPVCGSKVGLYIQGEPVYLCSNKKCGKYFGTMPCHLDENISDEYISPEDVDLSSFKPKKELNPKFWASDGHLDYRVRIKLLDIAEDFLKFLSIDWIEPKDIVLTGSLAGLTYNEKYSDVDIHIVIDYDEVGENKELIDNYFYSQKKLWNEEHKDLSIFGFPVEIFVEDYGHPAKGAVYSLLKEKWIDRPEKDIPKLSPESKKNIKSKISEYTKVIDSLVNDFKKSKNNEYLLKILGKKTNKIFKQIKDERQAGLEKSEFSEGNLIFKSLRRNGYLAQIIDLKQKIYDASHSLS